MSRLSERFKPGQVWYAPDIETKYVIIGEKPSPSRPSTSVQLITIVQKDYQSPRSVTTWEMEVGDEFTVFQSDYLVRDIV